MSEHLWGLSKYSLRWLFVASTAAALLLWNIAEYSLVRFMIGCLVLCLMGELIAHKEEGLQGATLVLAGLWGCLPAFVLAGPSVWRAFWSGNTASLAVRGEITLVGYAVMLTLSCMVLFALCLWIGYAVSTTIAFFKYLFGRVI